MHFFPKNLTDNSEIYKWKYTRVDYIDYKGIYITGSQLAVKDHINEVGELEMLVPSMISVSQLKASKEFDSLIS